MIQNAPLKKGMEDGFVFFWRRNQWGPNCPPIDGILLATPSEMGEKPHIKAYMIHEDTWLMEAD